MVEKNRVLRDMMNWIRFTYITSPLRLKKEHFLELARNYTSLTKEETSDLDALQKTFPYSQVIHNLASRGAQDHQLETSKVLLNISAVYSTDRSVLREIITSPRTERGAVENLAVVNVAIPNDHFDGVVADEILVDLERLQELKHNFLLSLDLFVRYHTKLL